MPETIPNSQKSSQVKESFDSQVVDHDSLHRYRTEMPNILLDIGLDAYELTLYLHIKRIAGDKGKCFVSNDSLAGKTKICRAKIITLKTCLQKKGLIKIIPKKRKDGGDAPPDIEIIDLWPQNFEHFKKIKEVKRGSTTCDGGVHEIDGGVHEIDGGGLSGRPIRRTNIKKNISKEEYISPKVEKLILCVLDNYNEHRKAIKESPLQRKDIPKDWIIEAQRLLKAHAEKKIYDIISFTFSDPFWRKVVKCPGTLRKNFTTLEDRLAEGKCSAEKLKTLVEENVKWLESYCAWRERVGAMGILHYNSDKAYDEKSSFEWKLTDPKMKNKIKTFYKNYR